MRAIGEQPITFGEMPTFLVARRLERNGSGINGSMEEDCDAWFLRTNILRSLSSFYVDDGKNVATGFARKTALAEHLQPHIQVEDYFTMSGRTYRKGRRRLWFDETVKPRLLKLAFQAAGVYNRGCRNAISPQVRQVDLFFPNLPPAFEGYKILHLSDVHIDEMDGLAERLLAILDRLRPDICLLTGDYRYAIRGSCAGVYDRMQKVLSGIHAIDGIFGILGNHDAAEIAFRLEEMGVRMLINEAVDIQRDTSKLWLIGVDDPFDYCCDDLNAAAKAVPSNEFKILLAHTPGLYHEAAAHFVHLYLCGHTHAGQIRLPFIGAIKKNGDYPRPYVQGKWEYNGMQAYTSWGAGCSTLPVRFNCPPEVAVLQLRRTQKNRMQE